MEYLAVDGGTAIPDDQIGREPPGLVIAIGVYKAAPPIEPLVSMSSLQWAQDLACLVCLVGLFWAVLGVYPLDTLNHGKGLCHKGPCLR